MQCFNCEHRSIRQKGVMEKVNLKHKKYNLRSTILVYLGQVSKYFDDRFSFIGKNEKRN